MSMMTACSRSSQVAAAPCITPEGTRAANQDVVDKHRIGSPLPFIRDRYPAAKALRITAPKFWRSSFYRRLLKSDGLPPSLLRGKGWNFLHVAIGEPNLPPRKYLNDNEITQCSEASFNALVALGVTKTGRKLLAAGIILPSPASKVAARAASSRFITWE
jgi:hypothetical protein